MEDPILTSEKRFAVIVEEMLASPGVTPPADGAGAKRGFGASALKVYDKIFAMLVRGSLVLKLPRSTVDALVDAGKGERFDPRRDGRAMKEWIMLGPDAVEEWVPLAREALAFVGAKR